MTSVSKPACENARATDASRKETYLRSQLVGLRFSGNITTPADLQCNITALNEHRQDGGLTARAAGRVKGRQPLDALVDHGVGADLHQGAYYRQVPQRAGPMKRCLPVGIQHIHRRLHLEEEGDAGLVPKLRSEVQEAGPALGHAVDVHHGLLQEDAQDGEMAVLEGEL